VVRSFDINGGHTYDPGVPDFINTLDYMGPGYGYQIKMSQDAELLLLGNKLPTTATMPLTTGWNWPAYWLNDVAYREASYPPTTEIYTLSLHDALPISIYGGEKL